MNKIYKDIPTNVKGVRVHVTGYKNAEIGCTLRGYAIDKNGIKIDGSSTLRRVAKTADDIPNAERHLVAAALNKLSIKAESESHTGSIIEDLDPKHPMVIAYQEMLAEGLKISENWKETVEKRAISLFARHALPRILRYSTEPFCEADRDKLLQEIAKDVRNHGNSHQNENTVLNTARSNLATCAIVYSNGLRRIDPMLPELALAPLRFNKKYTQEQIKSLPRAVRRKFAQLLKKYILESPLLVLGAVMMDDCAARTSEAAAVIPSRDIEDTGKQMILKVCWQEENGIRSAILKTDAAYRKVPLSKWGMEMVKLCCQYIKAWPDDPNAAPITAEELRQFVRKVLQESGLDEAFWAAAKAAEAKDPDRDSNGKPIYDVTAYVLRRNRASIWRNICGFLSIECDYFLGHRDKIAKKRKVDYRLDTELQRIGTKLENYVADPEMSAHPAIMPLFMKHGDDAEMLPYEEFDIVNTSDNPLMIDFDLIAAEAGEEIEIYFESGEIVSLTPRHRKTHGTRDNKPLIGTDQLTGFCETEKDENEKN